MSLPAAASALEFEIVNESGRSPEDVHVTVAGEDFEGSGATPEVPQALESNNELLTIDKLIAGRIYISFGAGVDNSVNPQVSSTRYDWVELNVHPVPADVINLTAVDQFGIAMRLDSFDAEGHHLEGIGSANSDTIFAALQQIPGGPQATMRNGSEIIRVLSPNKSSVYPDLGEYVRSMAGQTITLHSPFFSTEYDATSVYSGTFAADGSIVLSGTTNPPGKAPPTTPIAGPQLISDIYTGGNTPNTLEGAIHRDLLAGFSTGLWGGRYGNDAINFCSVPSSNALGVWCPHFNVPAFGDARLSLSPFPTCEQYAAVINQHSDAYGNPYSDASKKVTIGTVQSEGAVPVDKVRLTIQPDAGNAQPEASGNPNCGAAAPALPPAAPPAASTAARVKLFKLFKKARVRGARARIGRIVCASRCGRVKLIAKKGRKVLGRGRASVKGSKAALMLRLTKPGKRLLARKRRLKAMVTVWVTPPGGKSVRRRRAVLLLDKSAHRQRVRQGSAGWIVLPE